jgi:hypothetical protein
MTNSNTLREAIIKLIYEEEPDTPWLTDAFYDKLLFLIESEFKEREKKIYKALALAQSMILSGEKMSEHSDSIFQDAFATSK